MACEIVGSLLLIARGSCLIASDYVAEPMMSEVKYT